MNVTGTLSGLRNRAGDVAGGGVEAQAPGEALGGDGDRPLPGYRQMVKEGMAGPGAVNARPIDARRERRRRGADGAGIIRNGRRLAEREQWEEQRSRSREESGEFWIFHGRVA